MKDEFSDPNDIQQPEIRVSATFRIFGRIENLPEITDALNLSPTHTHRKGDIRSVQATPYENDMWSLKAPVSREEPLEKHLLWLKGKLTPHRDYIRKLRQYHTVEIFCGYRTDSDQGGFDLSPDVLSMFSELGIRMCVSVIVT